MQVKESVIDRLQCKRKRQPGGHLTFDLRKARHGTKRHIENQW
jgi:hypothetical protein